MRLTAGTTTNIRAKILDTHGVEDIHDCTFTSRDTNILTVQKTGPNTAALTAVDNAQGATHLDVVYEGSGAYNEIIEVDDRDVGTVTLEIAN